MKKMQAQKTMEKKESKVNEINKLLREDITPTLEKLRSQRSAYLQWASNSTEIERLHRQETAYLYYQARETLREGDEENRLLAEELQLKDALKRVEKEESELHASMKRLEDARSARNGDEVEEVHRREVEKSKELVKENSSYVNEIQSVDREKQELRRSEERLRLSEKSVSELRERLRRKEVECEHVKKDLAEERVSLEALEKRLEGKESGSSFSELVSGQRRWQVEVASRIKQLDQRYKEGVEELKRCEERVKRCASDAASGESALRACEERIQSARSELSSVAFDASEFDRLEARVSGLERECSGLRRSLEEAESEVSSSVQFRYTDPEPGFDRSRVKGVVAELIEVREERYSQAVEVAAGGKLYQVVVDSEKTGELLLKKGRLQRRVTIIPLNRIKHRTLPQAKVAQAQRVAPRGQVQLALMLVGYEKSVQEAIEYVFGSTLVCESLEVARKVTFNPAIRARTVTVEGDVFEPSGIVEGGSRRRGAPVLSLLAKANKVRGELDAKERELEASSRELSEMRKRAEKYRSAKSALELALHNLEVLEKAEGVAEEALVREEAKKKKEEVRELKRLLEEACEEEKKGSERLLELEAREKEVEKGVVMEAEVEACRVRVRDLTKASEECVNACEELRLECEEVCGECASLRESIAKQEAGVAEHGKRVEGLERRVREVKEEYEKVKREASEKKEEARRQSEELRGLEKALEACASERVRVEGVLKQNGVKKAKLEKARSEAERRVASLLSEHKWLASEESEVGKEGGDYDFKRVKMEEVHSRVVALEEEQEQLGRRLNKKVLGMMEKAESEYEELLKKREIIEKDKSQIEKVIEELDVKKKETLATTYAKVNRDFGSIFSTLLPDASARLEPSNGNVLEGLEVRVAFGGKEKESLSELSGGQRSLLALSLVLSLLLFKPAPMYILDEVDAALDLSHTQNIGRMLRKHFGQSQFIVVSLKEGMFTNANVLFRTKFVDGVSTVTRTVGQVEEGEEEGEKRRKRV
ncbi:structural maintenance of chromosomes protein 2 [Blastocystis sp. ATCC 50177/Nand II]|uniref:Structural maintenance of chromosomes protein 2 n=1 Tax=Blastocystis sp. subtype 1 (strain ATCC 50177 / NandII) TaxID=478820 RepID=A0A196SFD7_BLAHN|nr:structural maintenance of chromosomes protein 2 [Blastocystis sp. ATCC 50177/Nand II]